MKRLLSGSAFAALIAMSAVANAGVPTSHEQDPANYEPGYDVDGEWGMQAPVVIPEDPQAPPVQQNTIESVRFEDMPGLNGGFLFIPPDPHAAVGPNHIITIVNCSIQWYLKAGGAPQNIQPLGKQTAAVVNAFFNSLTPANALFDPKVIYDQYNGRFLVVALEQVNTTAPVRTSRVLFAVSDDSDPNGTWYFHSLNTKIVDASTSEYWFDYPGLAVDQNHIYLTGNMFEFVNGPGPTSLASRLWIMNKAPFYAGGAATFNPGNPFNAAALAVGPDAPYVNSTMMPSHMFGAPPPGMGTFLTMYSGLNDGVNEFIQTIRVDNPGGVPVFTGSFVSLGDIDNTVVAIPNGLQPGSDATQATRINNNDRRALHAVWQSGHLYTCFQTNPNAPNVNAGQSTAYWLKTSTAGAGAFVDGGYIGGEDFSPSAWTSFPSIAVDKIGNIGVCVAVGSPTTFASAAYTTHNVTDPIGFTHPLTVYANGQAFYKRTFSSSTAARNRWGDYTGTAIDPDGCIFWSYNEYAGTQGTPTTVSGVTENGRWWTRAVSYYVDDNANGIPDACQPVAVVLSKFEVVREGEDAVLRWSVAEEHDHLGFNVYRETEGGAKVQLHVGLLTGDVDYEFRELNAPGGATTYWLQEVDRNGKATWLGSITLEPASSKPMVAQIYGASPNPFARATTVSYSLGVSGHVNLAVFDLQGRKVATLVDGSQDAGSHTSTWNGQSDNGSSITAGFYFIKLQTAGQIKNTKVVLTKDGASN